MSGLEAKEYKTWRRDIDDMFGLKYPYVGVEFIDPTLYFNFETKNYESEKEIRNFDLNLLAHSNLVIVNFNAPQSIGTAQELALAKEWKIPCLGLNEQKYNLHPWLVECCERIFYDKSSLIKYVAYFYTN